MRVVQWASGYSSWSHNYGPALQRLCVNICVCVCVCGHVTVGWRKAIVRTVFATETERRGWWQQPRLHQRVCVCLRVFRSVHLCIWTCLNILHKHICLSCVIYVFHEYQMSNFGVFFPPLPCLHERLTARVQRNTQGIEFQLDIFLWVTPYKLESICSGAVRI